MSEISSYASISSAASSALASRASSTAQSVGSASGDAKIDKAGKDFEALLLTNWLQQAEQSFAKVPGTDEEEQDSDSTSEQYMSLGMEALGSAMAASGGIGIAKMISAQLRKTEEREATNTAQQNP